MQLVNIVHHRKPYLINIKLGDDVIKEGVQIIEQLHNLMRIIVDDFAVSELMLVDLVEMGKKEVLPQELC